MLCRSTLISFILFWVPHRCLIRHSGWLGLQLWTIPSSYHQDYAHDYICLQTLNLAPICLEKQITYQQCTIISPDRMFSHERKYIPARNRTSYYGTHFRPIFNIYPVFPRSSSFFQWTVDGPNDLNGPNMDGLLLFIDGLRSQINLDRGKGARAFTLTLCASASVRGGTTSSGIGYPEPGGLCGNGNKLCLYVPSRGLNGGADDCNVCFWTDCSEDAVVR